MANSAFTVTGSATGTGSVTSVAVASLDGLIAVTGSPITTSGTINLALNTLPVSVGGTGITSTTANQLLYSPSNNTIAGLATGNSSVLVTSSTGVPSWVGPLTNGQLIIGSTGATPAVATLSPGTGVTITNGAGTITISATGSGGTVTSVTASTPLASTGGNTPNISLSGIVSEIHGGTNQSTYTLGDTLYSSATNTLSKLAGNITTSKQYLSQTGTGSVSAAPVWSTISSSDITGAALTATNDTNVTITLGGSPSNALLNAASLTMGWSGQLAVARGGTGLNSVSQGDLLYGSVSNTLATLGKDTNATRYLSNQGASNNPSWNQVNLANGVTGNLSVFNLNTGINAASNTYWSGNGTWSVPGGTLQNVTYLKSGSGTFTPAATTKAMIVQALGGGGGGGGTNCTVSTFGAGGGGGSAGWCQIYITSVASSYTYTVGVGGSGGAAGVNAGTAGTSSTFAGGAVSLLAQFGSPGGGGSAGAVNQLNGVPGGHGVATGGDINFEGNTGGFGISGNLAGNVSIGGAGAPAPASGGGGSANVLQMTGTQTGSPAAANSGGGGAGGAAILSAVGAAGGAGGSGLIVVYEFS